MMPCSAPAGWPYLAVLGWAPLLGRTEKRTTSVRERGVHMGHGRRAAILTVSDGVFHGTRTDDSGRALGDLLARSGFEIAEIEAALRRMAAAADLVVTTGGTGFGPRDVTPEATKAVLTRDAPGLAETMRAVGRQVSPMAIISRGRTGIVGDALVLNLPCSPKGAVESLETVMPVVPHVLDLL